MFRTTRVAAAAAVVGALAFAVPAVSADAAPPAAPSPAFQAGSAAAAAGFQAGAAAAQAGWQAGATAAQGGWQAGANALQSTLGSGPVGVGIPGFPAGQLAPLGPIGVLGPGH